MKRGLRGGKASGRRHCGGWVREDRRRRREGVRRDILVGWGVELSRCEASAVGEGCGEREFDDDGLI